MQNKISTQHMVLCAMFTVLIVAGAFIKIPIPVIPFTLQIFFTMMAGLLLGSRLGTISVGLYVFLGLAGLPVFAEGGGIWYFLKPSFGYLIGFLVGTYVTGKLVEKKEKLSFGWILFSNFVGLFLIYGMGMIYYYIICNYVIHMPIGVGALFFYCFVLVVPGDTCLCFLAAFLAKRLIPVIRKNGI